MERIAMTRAIVLLAAVLAAGPAQPPQTVQRPGETAPRPRAPGSGTTEPTGVVRGHVVGADGRPLRQAQVKLAGSALQQPRNETTDADGRYEATGLPADTYTITAGRTGYATIEFGQRRLSYPGTRVKVGDGEVVERIDFVLPRAGTIAGRVVDENGDPVEGAGVALLELQYVNGRRTLVDAGHGHPTNDLGRFRLFGAPPGQYVLIASAAAAGPFRLPGYAPTVYPGSTNVADAQVISLAAGDDQPGIEIQLVPGRAAKISGTVFEPSGQPYRGRLLLTGSERSGTLTLPAVQASVQPDGAFSIPNIPPGDYVLKTGFPGTFAAQFVAVSDADVSGLALRTSSGSTVSGHITFEGAPSRVTPQSFQFNFVQTDVDLGPAPGVYRAKINDDWTFEYAGLFGSLLIRPSGGPQWLVKSIRAGGADITDTPLALGRREQSLTDVEVVLTNRAAQAAGTVSDARGQPVAACTVVVFPADRDRWQRPSRFVKAARCDPDGTFTVRGLPTSEYFVAAVDRIQEANGSGEWQDPAVLEALSTNAARTRLTEEQTASLALRLIVR
jgi:carboxypeptidase family protein